MGPVGGSGGWLGEKKSGITLIYGKELIVKICSHVIIFSHGTKLVAVCEILFTR